MPVVEHVAFSPAGGRAAFANGPCLQIQPDNYVARSERRIAALGFVSVDELLVVTDNGGLMLVAAPGSNVGSASRHFQVTEKTAMSAPYSPPTVIWTADNVAVVQRSQSLFIVNVQKEGLFVADLPAPASSEEAVVAVSGDGGAAVVTSSGVIVPKWGKASVLPRATAVAFADGASLFAYIDREFWFADTTGARIKLPISYGFGVGPLAASRTHLAISTGFAVDVFRYERGLISSSRGWTILATGASVSTTLFLVIVWDRRRRDLAWQSGLWVDSSSSSATDPETVPIPLPPPDLINALRDDNCVVFVGPGVPLTGDPDALDITAHLLSALDPSDRDALVTALERGRTELVIERAGQLLGPERTRACLQGAIDHVSAGPVHHALAQLPIELALTTDWSDALEEVWDSDVVATPATPGLKEQLFSRQRMLVKLHGAPDDPASPLFLTTAQFNEYLTTNMPFTEFLDAIFASRSVLFIGFDLTAIEQYPRRAVRLNSQMQHFALLEATGSEWRAEADYARDKFNLHVIPLASDTPAQLVLGFLSTLRHALDASNATETGPQAPYLAVVGLNNVGPFVDLRLELDKERNVFLGDNGVGKSTVLKAIGMVLAGNDAQAYAERLLSVDAKQGTITLEMSNGVHHVVELKRTSSGAELRTVTARPMDTGVFAIGFPAIRTIPWTRVEPGRVDGEGAPRSDDVLPLIAGGLDPRVDSLKAWLLALDGEIAKGNARLERVRDDFFRIAAALTTGLNISFLKVADKRLMITTDDGPLPIEAVSQGTASLLSWIGVLLQRMHALYRELDQPRDGPVLILIDEIDAHMHPGWQRGLLQQLKAEFGKAQFIVSTHSPLIVSGLLGSQVKRFVRDRDGHVVTVPIDDYVTLGRADQLLTSRLFGLNTTVDPETEQAMEDYRALAGREEELTDGEKTKFRELERTLENRLAPSGETPYHRRTRW